MHWIVVYDFASEWFSAWDWLHVPFGLIALLAATLLLRRRNDVVDIILGLVFAVGGGAMLVSQSTRVVGIYQQLSQVYHERAYQIAEGTIEKFESICDSHHAETFDVNGVRFGYGLSVLHPGFGQTRCWGGPLRGGLYVKIWHITLQDGGHYILRVEIRR